MKKANKQVFVCADCGTEYSKWQGKCDACGQWGVIKEWQTSTRQKRGGSKIELVNIGKIKTDEKDKIKFESGVGEFDRVLGGGIVKGSVILLAGEPGIGKSTLISQVLGMVGGLYVAGEESARQISTRMERLKIDGEKIDVLEGNDIDSVCEVIDRYSQNYNLVVVDSIQMMRVNEIGAMAGSVAQVRESTFRLVEVAKKRGIAIIIIGHVTKSGDIAGPKLVEHMVDVVLNFEKENNNQEIRLVRAKKNRFGETDEIGLFKMTGAGLMGVEKEEISLLEHQGQRIGSVISLAVEGNRMMLIEVQALVVESMGMSPKRVFRGVDFSRGQLMVAVLAKIAKLPLYKCDIYVTISGGLKVTDPGVDLAIIGAIYSSYTNKVFNNKLAIVGEVSLLGDVKNTSKLAKKERQIKRFGLNMVEVSNVGQLVKMAN